MKHNVMCRCCKQRFNANPEDEGITWLMPSKNFYYHFQCYNDWVKKKNDVHTQADEDLWFDAVWQFLKKNLKIINGGDNDYIKIKKQWNSYLSKGFTPKGIYFSVLYFYTIKKGDPSKAKGGIGIVPFIYKEATDYWVAKEIKERGVIANIEKQIKMAFQQETIVLNNISKKKKKKAFDLNDI